MAPLSQDHLRELLAEVQGGIERVVATTREGMDALLDAVMAVSSGLDLDRRLNQIATIGSTTGAADPDPIPADRPSAGRTAEYLMGLLRVRLGFGSRPRYTPAGSRSVASR